MPKFIFIQVSHWILRQLLLLFYFCFISLAIASSDLSDNDKEDEDFDRYLRAHENSEYGSRCQKYGYDKEGNKGIEISDNGGIGNIYAPIAGTNNTYINNTYINGKESDQVTKAVEKVVEKTSPSLSTIRYIDNYYPRTESANLEDLTKKLEENNVVAITGIAGAGKTQLASYYILEVYKKHYPKNMVLKLLADTQENLDMHYKKFAIAYLGMSEDIKDIEAVKLFVKQRLSEKMEEGFLLFFDNVDSLSVNIITTYFPEKVTGKASQIIITSQKQNFFRLAKERNFYLDSLTEREVVEFICKGDRSFTEEEALSIAGSVSGLMLGIQCAKMYLMTNPHLDVDEYLQLLQDEAAVANIEADQDALISEYYTDKQDGYRFQRAAISLSIKQLSPEAQYLLKCCSFFYPDKIPFQTLQRLFAAKFNLANNSAVTKTKFNTIFKELKDSSLIQYLRGSSVNSSILSMHGITQKAARMGMGIDERLEILELIADFFYRAELDNKRIKILDACYLLEFFIPDFEEVALKIFEMCSDGINYPTTMYDGISNFCLYEPQADIRPPSSDVTELMMYSNVGYYKLIGQGIDNIEITSLGYYLGFICYSKYFTNLYERITGSSLDVGFSRLSMIMCPFLQGHNQILAEKYTHCRYKQNFDTNYRARFFTCWIFNRIYNFLRNRDMHCLFEIR